MLLTVMLAYFIVSVGSVLVSMRADAARVMGLVSVLYALTTIGLMLFLLHPVWGGRPAF